MKASVAIPEVYDTTQNQVKDEEVVIPVKSKNNTSHKVKSSKTINKGNYKRKTTNKK